jgi:acyl-coenzyme A synthetase/AMP-(fatty) acid ligase
MERTMEAFQGEWYVSGDMVSRSPDGFFTYHGRGDDMLKVSGKWLAP